MKGVIAMLVLTGCVTAMASAQSTPQPALTLAAALAEANAHNPDILAAQHTIDIARAALTQAAPAPLEVRAAPGVTQDVPQGLGSLQTFSADASTEFSPALGAQRRAARSGISVAQAQFAATQRDVDQRVVSAYYGLASAQAVVVAAQQSVTNAQQLEHSAVLRSRVGAAGSFEVLRSRVELRRAETDLLRARANVSTAQIALDVLLGRSAGAQTTVMLAPAPVSSLDIGVLYLKAETLDPLLSQYRASITQALAQARAAELQRAPRVGLQGGYVFQRAPGGNGAISRGPTASVMFSLPLLDFGTIRGAVREARARQALAQAQLQARDEQLRAELLQDVVQVQSAQARLAFSRASLSQAQEGLRLAQFGYQRGALGVLDVLSARNQLAAAQAEVTQASADLGAAVARLKLTVGEPISS